MRGGLLTRGAAHLWGNVIYILTADVKQRKQNILNNEPNPDNKPLNKENK